jgi:hypothetical protein
VGRKKKRESKMREIILLLALGLCSGMAHGQFMQIIMNVEKKVGLEQINTFMEDIPTGPLKIEQMAGTGTLSAFGMFAITAQENIIVIVRLEAPAMLLDGQNNAMPFDLTMAWQNDGTPSEATAKPAKDNKSVFPLSNSGLLIENMKGAPSILHAYLFLKGTAIIPKTPTSRYEGTVHLIVEYE